MKLKAYFEKIKNQGKIGGDDFQKFIDGLNDDLEIPDVAANLIEDNFLTRDRALADFKIINKIKAEALNGVDAVLAKFTPIIDGATKEEIEKEQNTYKKLELIQAAIPKVIEKAQTGNPNSEERVKQLEKNSQELVEKIKAINADNEKKEREIKQQFEEREKNLKLDWTLEKKVSSLVFADEYTGVKDAVLKGILTDIRAKNQLALNEQDELVVVEIDPTTQVKKQKFNGNDPVTIDNLLAEPIKPFLKKSNGGESNKNGLSGQRPPVATPPNNPAAYQHNIERRKAKPNTPSL